MSDTQISRAEAVYRSVFNASMPGHVRETLCGIFEGQKTHFSRVDTRLEGYTAIPLVIGIMAAQRLKRYTVVCSNLYQRRAMIDARDNPLVLTATKRRYLTIKLDTEPKKQG